MEQPYIDVLMEIGEALRENNKLLGRIAKALEEGYSVRTPFANFSSSIKGTFSDISDVYHSGSHRVVPVVNPGKALRSHYKSRLRTQKVRQVQHSPNPSEFTDVISAEINKRVTPTGMGKISGHYLKVDQEDPKQGIFFKHESRKEFRVSIIGENKPARLFFMIPADMPAGKYQILIRNEKGSGTLYRDLIVE